MLNRHTAIAVSLAEVETRLGYYRDAAEHWSYYLEKAPPDRQEERSRAEEQLAECRKHIGELHIQGDGAAAYVDERFVGFVPATVWVEPGERKVQVATEGRFSQARLITIGAGESQTVEIKLPPSSRSSSQHQHQHQRRQ